MAISTLLYYVAGDGNGGSDATNDGLLPTTAFSTIQHALIALGYAQGAAFTGGGHS
jgi:hypothetical protein